MQEIIHFADAYGHNDKDDGTKYERCHNNALADGRLTDDESYNDEVDDASDDNKNDSNNTDKA